MLWGVIGVNVGVDVLWSGDVGVCVLGLREQWVDGRGV